MEAFSTRTESAPHVATARPVDPPKTTESRGTRMRIMRLMSLRTTALPVTPIGPDREADRTKVKCVQPVI